MKFWQFLRFAPAGHLPALATVAEDSGFHGAMLVDHMFVPEEQKSESNNVYGPHHPWPDPWAAIGGMVEATKRLQFSTCIYILPLRNPFDVAKSISTLSVMSNNRVSPGFGVGWMKEEYDAVGVDFATRGGRYTEMIEVMQLLWHDEMVEYHGEFFDFPRIQMNPTPAGDIAFYLGGNAKVAKRRAVRYANGWMCQNYRRSEMGDIVKEMQGLLAAAGRENDLFEIIVCAGSKLDAMKEFRDHGVTSIINLPTLDDIGPGVPFDTMKRFIEDYAENIIQKM